VVLVIDEALLLLLLLLLFIVAAAAAAGEAPTMVLLQVCQCALHQLRLDALVPGCLLQQLEAGR
jgi:hypothetical protein